MIVEALRTGFIEGNGKHYPAARGSSCGRGHNTTLPAGSIAWPRARGLVEAAARLGAHMVMFSDRPWHMRLPAIQRNRELHQRFHGRRAPAMMITDFCICGPDLAEAEENAKRYMGKFVESNFHHYEFLGEHFATVKGYDAYAQKAEIARKGGLEGAVAGFMQAAIWGTPDRILRELEARRGVLGDFELNVAFRFGGVPFDIAERGVKMFAAEVLPVLKTWRTENAALAAE